MCSLNRRKKVNKKDESLACLYKYKFVFFYKEKKIGKYTAKLTFLWYDILVKKGSLQRNGMAAIPKFNFEGDWCKCGLRLLLAAIKKFNVSYTVTVTTTCEIIITETYN